GRAGDAMVDRGRLPDGQALEHSVQFDLRAGHATECSGPTRAISHLPRAQLRRVEAARRLRTACDRVRLRGEHERQGLAAPLRRCRSLTVARRRTRLRLLLLAGTDWPTTTLAQWIEQRLSKSSWTAAEDPRPVRGVRRRCDHADREAPRKLIQRAGVRP